MHVKLRYGWVIQSHGMCMKLSIYDMDLILVKIISVRKKCSSNHSIRQIHSMGYTCSWLPLDGDLDNIFRFTVYTTWKTDAIIHDSLSDKRFPLMNNKTIKHNIVANHSCSTPIYNIVFIQYRHRCVSNWGKRWPDWIYNRAKGSGWY